MATVSNRIIYRRARRIPQISRLRASGLAPKDPSVSRAIRIVLSGASANILWNNKICFPPNRRNNWYKGDVAAARPYRGGRCSVAHLPHLRRRRRRSADWRRSPLAPRAEEEDFTTRPRLQAHRLHHRGRRSPPQPT